MQRRFLRCAEAAYVTFGTALPRTHLGPKGPRLTSVVAQLTHVGKVTTLRFSNAGNRKRRAVIVITAANYTLVELQVSHILNPVAQPFLLGWLRRTRAPQPLNSVAVQVAVDRRKCGEGDEPVGPHVRGDVRSSTPLGASFPGTFFSTSFLFRSFFFCLKGVPSRNK